MEVNAPMLQLKPEKMKLTLLSTKYEGDIIGNFGMFTVTQSFLNDNPADITVQYTFPMPEDAVLDCFHICSGEKQIHSTILERDRADDFSVNARQQGLSNDIFVMDDHTAFTLAIGRVKSKNKLTIIIKYMQRIRNALEKTKIIIPSFTDALASYINHCTVDFEIKYAPLGKIEAIDSPTHKITSDLLNDMALITFHEIGISKDHLVLEITEVLEESIVYYNNDYCLYQFPLLIDTIPQQKSTEYLFLLDCSDAMTGEKFAQTKDALKVCLKNLQDKDTFNIIAFENLCHYFSLNSLPFHQKSMESAIRWLEGLKPMGEAYLTEALRHTYEDAHKNRIVILIANGEIADKKECLRFINDHKTDELYTFCTNSLSDISFFNELTKARNGNILQLQIGQRLDDAILSLFNHATTPGLYNVKINLEGTVNELSPKGFAKVIKDERLCIVAKRVSEISNQLTLKGFFNNKDYSAEITFSKHETSMDLEPIFTQMRLQSLLNLHTDEGNTSDILTKREIINLSLAKGIITPFTVPAVVLHINDPQGNPVMITVPALLKKNFTKREVTESAIIARLMKQNTDGSFGNGSMLETANALSTLFNEATDCFTYRYIIKKSIVFLFDSIEKGHYDVLPKEVIHVFSIWCKFFAEQDLFSKKVEAIVFMNRDLL